MSITNPQLAVFTLLTFAFLLANQISTHLTVEEGFDAVERRMQLHDDIVSSNASYLQGVGCLIKMTPDVTVEQTMRYASACAHAHEEYVAELSAQEEITNEQ